MQPKQSWLSLLTHIVGAVAVLAVLIVLGLRVYFSGGGEAEFWESNIAAFEASDAEAMPAPGAVLFTGSSSIRLWDSLSEDMAPFRVLNRGFGGAHMAHVNFFAPRIVFPYAPSAIVVYAGDNDVAAGKSAERVVADYNTFVSMVRGEGLDVPIFFIPIKPSPLRWEIWPEQNEANLQIAEQSRSDPKLHYIDTATPMLALAEDGQAPPSRLFMVDGLHLSKQGYELWARVVHQALAEALGDESAR